MAVRANVVFPILIPSLVVVPITKFNARALGALVSVAGGALNKRLSAILSALMESISLEKDQGMVAELWATVKALLLSIEDAEGLNTLMMTLFETVKDDDPAKREISCAIVTMFCTESKVTFQQYVSDWMRVLISLFDDRQTSVVVAAWHALNAITRTVRKEDLEELVIPVRRAVKAVGVPGVDLPGFCLPRGIGPILPVFLQGLTYGTAEIREQAALAVGN